MEYLTFIYNLLLIVLFAMCITSYIVFYARARKPANLWVSALFLLFIAENTILYMTDFLESFAEFYNPHTLNSSLLKTVISAGVYLCYIQILCAMVRQRPNRADWIGYGVYVLSLLLVPWLPTNRFTYWLYFTLSQFMLFYLLVLAFRRMAALPADTPGREKYHKQLRLFLLVTLVLNVCIVIEDGIVIPLYDDLEALRINQRNVSEDIQSIFFAVSALYYFFKSFVQAPQPVVEVEPERLGQYAEVSAALRETRLNGLARAYNLTGRETEVLGLLVQGKANQQISEELFISVGTVKNHIHNIYRKTGATGRGSVLAMIERVEV